MTEQKSDSEHHLTAWYHSFSPPPITDDVLEKSGKEIAISVGWNRKIAWDIYLFYPPIIEWTAIPPKPISWYIKYFTFNPMG
ncbi:MAG: hypothetical protein JRE14_07745 [Deltaproteobacteria bacterium]|nr:hypothetical protein [Deltaproteobacteria bacterium]